MDRWDFDCQSCGKNIGDAFYTEPYWYRCGQDTDKYELLEKTFKAYVRKNLQSLAFDSQGVITTNSGLPDEKILNQIKKNIIECMDKKWGGIAYHSGFFFYINMEEKTAWWSPTDIHEFSDDNYQRAGIKNHPINGRGRGRLGYCLCKECVEEDDGQFCTVCGTEMVKVTADEHPGGHWGIRGQREPAPMR